VGQIEAHVAPGPASIELATRLAKALKLPELALKHQIFEDGESMFEIDQDIQGAKIILVQSTLNADHYMQAFLMSHTMSLSGAEVILVSPYMGYTRQYRQFLEGQSPSLGTIAHILRTLGVRRLATVDIHSPESLAQFAIPTYSVSSIPLLAEYLKSDLDVRAPLVCSAKLENEPRIEALTSLIAGHQFDPKPDKGRRLVGKDMIVLCDLPPAQQTLERTLRQLGQRCKDCRIIFVCIHPLLATSHLELLEEAEIKEIISTNTIPSAFGKVDVTPALSSHLSSLDLF
jgi:ribose-phosphate pyrophosphokinase